MCSISSTLGLSLCVHTLNIKTLSAALRAWRSGLSKQLEELITNCKLYSKAWVNSRLSLLPSALPERLCQAVGNQSFWIAKAALLLAANCAAQIVSPLPPAYVTNVCAHVSGFTLVQMRQNLLLRYKYKTQNLIDELVKYPLSTLSCSQKGTFLSSRILEIFFLRLRVLAGSISGLIKGLQICTVVHKSRSPYWHRGEGDAESIEKSVEAKMSFHHLWEADLHKECSLNQSCPYSSGKPCPPRKHKNLGSRNRISSHWAGMCIIRSPNINSSVRIPEFTCTQFLSHKMSPSLHTLCIHQLWQAVKKMLTSLAKIFSLFLTTCATHSFQLQWFPFTLPLPPPCTDPRFFISHTPLLFLFFTHEAHSNCLYFSISVSHIRLAGQSANRQTWARYGSSEIQTQPQSGLCLEGFPAFLQEWIYELEHILIS